MREPLFCKKAVPAPSAKNSYMAGGRDNASVRAHGHAPVSSQSSAARHATLCHCEERSDVAISEA